MEARRAQIERRHRLSGPVLPHNRHPFSGRHMQAEVAANIRSPAFRTGSSQSRIRFPWQGRTTVKREPDRLFHAGDLLEVLFLPFDTPFLRL